ncbi:M4 family metallopeptidase [Pelomyxa schiedti]|nr:M4 family metallopeptidase [Pelomyxa schiedti]
MGTMVSGYTGRKIHVLEQYYHNIPVLGSHLKVEFDRDLAIVRASGSLFPLSASTKTTDPDISIEDARREAVFQTFSHLGTLAANSGMSRDIQVTDTHLAILSNSGTTHLAWVVTCEVESVFLQTFSIIDADTGRCTHYSESPSAMRRKVYHDFSLISDWGEGNKLPLDDPVMMSFMNTSEVFYNFMFSMHNWKSWDSRDSPITARFMKESFLMCPNAAFSPALGSFIFCPSTTCADVILHEMGHGVTSVTNELSDAYETGALNEAFSDIIAETITQLVYPRPEPRDPHRDCSDKSTRWIIGDLCTWKPYKKGIRDMYAPNCTNDAAHTRMCKCANEDSGMVHYNSGVPSSLYALLADGGIVSNLNLTGIGLLKAWHIHWLAKTEFGSAYSDFASYSAYLTYACSTLAEAHIPLKNYGDMKSALYVERADCNQLRSLISALGLDSSFCTDFEILHSSEHVPQAESLNIHVSATGFPRNHSAHLELDNGMVFAAYEIHRYHWVSHFFYQIPASVQSTQGSFTFSVFSRSSSGETMYPKNRKRTVTLFEPFVLKRVEPYRIPTKATNTMIRVFGEHFKQLGTQSSSKIIGMYKYQSVFQPVVCSFQSTTEVSCPVPTSALPHREAFYLSLNGGNDWAESALQIRYVSPEPQLNLELISIGIVLVASVVAIVAVSIWKNRRTRRGYTTLP